MLGHSSKVQNYTLNISKRLRKIYVVEYDTIRHNTPDPALI